jgi:hypothetical protein
MRPGFGIKLYRKLTKVENSASAITTLTGVFK